MRQRTTLRLIARKGARPVTVQATTWGEWCVHRASDGYVLSHETGLAFARELGPATAARLLRRLQQAPTCPFSSVVVVHYARWREAVLATLADGPRS
jgi:hypothetical protein